MPLHFIADGLSESVPGDDIRLTGAEAHHASSVRRLRAGELVTVGDGRGVWFEAGVVSVAAREVVLRAQSRTVVPAASPRLVLVQALAKGDRDERAVQAVTELGVEEIVPWQAARSISRWDAQKTPKGVARWTTIAREAAKQAHLAWVPVVGDPVTTARLAARADGARMYVLEPSASARLASLELDDTDSRDILVVVGPEGGIGPEELRALTDAGATLVRLGESVLRTSTAGLAALALLQAKLGRW